uniref:Uncharacterized protein n=1 Tax=Timema shepardi TaxID=629360 RepID=A0A7R9AXA6_TIMSH|nr:unnamed protein product [Timema shepardi]
MKMPLRDLGLRKLWSAVRPGRSNSISKCEAGIADGDLAKASSNESGDEEETGPTSGPPACSLPLLQVWPSQDSPRGEADGQSFVFPGADEGANGFFDLSVQHDSGIDSIQVSPSPGSVTQCPTIHEPPPPPPVTTSSPSPTFSSSRRPSTALLHPDHARLLRAPGSPEHVCLEEPPADFPVTVAFHHASCSSSTTSSMTSVAAATSRTSDPWLHPHDRDRRRSSTMTARYSLLDALDLEYALLRAAARGSVGPYSLSESIHKLTFTQSLAFPALARGLASKRSRSNQSANSRTLDPSDTGMNAFAKVVTALVLVLVSVLVFGVVYKFVRT